MQELSQSGECGFGRRSEGGEDKADTWLDGGVGLMGEMLQYFDEILGSQRGGDGLVHALAGRTIQEDELPGRGLLRLGGIRFLGRHGNRGRE